MGEQPKPQLRKPKMPFGRRLMRFAHRLAYQTWSNPIVLKELRGRMRGWRAAMVLIVHLATLGCFASFIYFVVAQSTSSSGGARAGQTMGQTLFYSTYLMLLVLVVFLSPAFTAGAISGERERKTLDLLITTLLPTHSLVVGKLISALAYILLLILAALPIQSLAFMFGGVVLSEMVIGTILLLVTALIVGSVGILISSIMKSSIASTVLTYATILLTSMGLPIIVGIILGFLGVFLEGILNNMNWLWQTVLLYLGGFLICTNPFATVVTTKLIQESEGTFFFFTVNIGSGVSYNAPLVSPWIVYTLLYTALSAVLILASILILRRKRG
jgi:ABC-type transport system involved in multi-copper enzyme maturation permease subunit